MSDATHVDPAKAARLAQKIVDLLANEDSDTRRRAIGAAAALLGENTHIPSGRPSQLSGAENGEIEADDVGSFFNREDDLKPSDYAHLCAAYFYSSYGPVSFSIEELRTLAREAGVILPDRIDKTLLNAAKNGRKLFQSAGKGSYKPTAAAGLYFRERWNVRPGKRDKSIEIND